MGVKTYVFFRMNKKYGKKPCISPRFFCNFTKNK